MIVKDLIGRQILDSRGNPTVECDLVLDCDSCGRGVSPSGASTGKLEALELRDGDKNKYHGMSVTKAIANINNIIKKKLIGMSFDTQSKFDNLLLEIDGTENKTNLGANSILSVSLAFANATAKSRNLNLYEVFGKKHALPVPMMNILNGGAHANNSLDFQEFMIVPLKYSSFSESLRAGAEIFHTLKKILSDKSFSTAVGDEGGYAPDIKTNEDAFDLILKAIEMSGYRPGEEVYIALDVASSEFYSNGMYRLSNKLTYDHNAFCEYLSEICAKYPIISIEDGMSEDDWDGWKELTKRLGDKIQLVGDDVFVTNPKILKKGIKDKVGNSILIKLNQIGTVSETLETINIAREANYNYIISHRSGETEDTSIADLSVGTFSNQIKTGSLSRSDRTSKYNRLIRIEEIVGEKMFNKGNVFSRWVK